MRSSTLDVAPLSLRVTPGPGLGITINEKLVRERSDAYTQDAWRNPQWRGEDGSLREW